MTCLVQYVSFQDVLGEIDLPAFHHPPDYSTYKVDLADAKASAIKQLSDIYRNAINPTGEE